MIAASNSYDSIFRLTAADSNATPIDRLFVLSKDHDFNVAEAAIDNLRRKNIPEATIMESAASGGGRMRFLVARSSETPIATLAYDGSGQTETALAATDNLLKRLFE